VMISVGTLFHITTSILFFFSLIYWLFTTPFSDQHISLLFV
jgi:hypothetical protein